MAPSPPKVKPWSPKGVAKPAVRAGPAARAVVSPGARSVGAATAAVATGAEIIAQNNRSSQILQLNQTRRKKIIQTIDMDGYCLVSE